MKVTGPIAEYFTIKAEQEEYRENSALTRIILKVKT